MAETVNSFYKKSATFLSDAHDLSVLLMHQIVGSFSNPVEDENHVTGYHGMGGIESNMRTIFFSDLTHIHR